MEDKLYAKAEIKREGKELIGVASTEAEDRHGEVVSIAGWDLKNAKKNCPLLWAHKHDEPAIGDVTKLWVDGTKAGKSKAKLMFKAFISDATERSRAIKQLVEEGVLKTFSVGFRGLEMVENKFTQQELLEISVVNVPANPEAMMLAYKSLKGDVSEDTMRDIGIQVDFIKELTELKTRVQTLEDKQSAKGDGSPAPQVDKPKVISRITLLKAMSRKADEVLEKEKHGSVPKNTRVVTLKLLKKNTDLLLASVKKDLNGSH